MKISKNILIQSWKHGVYFQHIQIPMSTASFNQINRSQILKRFTVQKPIMAQ